MFVIAAQPLPSLLTDTAHLHLLLLFFRLGDFFGDSGNPSSEFNPSGSEDGKYELLTAANEITVEEIKDLMTKSDIEGQHIETLLAGSLAKVLCYIHRMNKEVKDNQEVKSDIG